MDKKAFAVQQDKTKFDTYETWPISTCCQNPSIPAASTLADKRMKNTWFLNKPHIMAAWEGSGVLARYFKTPIELGRLESSNWSEMSMKRRDPTSLVTRRRCSKAELVTASNWAIPVTTICGLNFFITSIIKSDWRGASITVIPSVKVLLSFFC